MKVWLTLLVLGSALAQGDHHGHGRMALAELQKLSGKAFDIAFMSLMIGHHQGALEMAQAYLQTGKDPRVRRAAQEILKVQQGEILQLKRWLKAWYGLSPDPRYREIMRADMGPMMAALMGGKAPSPERAFLEGMIPHHQDAVAMAQLCLRRTNKKELREFCQGIIAQQSREIDEFRAWLRTMP